MAFGCAHLESGRSPELEVQRRNQLETIIKKSFITDSRVLNRNQYDWQSHDVKVIFGDLNFRNIQELTLEAAVRLVEQDDIESLQNYDEYITFSRLPDYKRGILKNYKEGTLTFGPTYKYLMKTNTYDLRRFPSYTDRILFEMPHDLP